MKKFLTRLSEKKSTIHTLIFFSLMIFPIVMFIGAMNSQSLIIFIGLLFVVSGNIFAVLTN